MGGRMRRGEVWWGEAAPPVGARPFLVVSRDILNQIRDSVIVSPVTSRIRGVPTEVTLGAAEGLPRPSAANLNTLMTLKQQQFTQMAGTLSPARLEEVNAALRWALDLD